jgi:hypothetical protein
MPVIITLLCNVLHDISSRVIEVQLHVVVLEIKPASTTTA